jgi:hypothetical protein
MLPRRVAVAVLALAVMLAVAAAVPGDATTIHTFRITVGLRDKEPTDWSGTITVVNGEVVSLAGWRFEEKDAVQDTTGWKCSTHKHAAPGARFPIPPGGDNKREEPALEPWPNGLIVQVKGATPTLTLTLPKEEVKFAAADLLLGEPKEFLDRQVRVERLPVVSQPRPPAAPKAERPTQDDYPAFWVRYRTAKHYLAWTAYQEGKDRVLLAERDGPDGVWSEPLAVTEGGDHFRVALAGTHDDVVWVVYAAQRDHRWNLFGRPYKAGKLGDEIALTDDAGPNFWHRMTTDGRGRAWLVWQAFHDGQSDVYARCADGDGWHEPVRVSTSKANDWDPAIAADPTSDRVWVGWDTYEDGHYGVRVRAISGGAKPELGEILKPEDSPRFGAHVSLACDKAGRLWTAWDEAGAAWGKDTGYLYQDGTGSKLYESRQIRVKCLVDGKWREPETPLTSVLTGEMKNFHELPQLQDDAHGRIWLYFRHRTTRLPRTDSWAAQAMWEGYATAFLGDRWLTPVLLPESAGRNDMRADSQRDRDGRVYFAYASDHRSWAAPGVVPRNWSVQVGRLDNAPKPVEPKLTERDHPEKGPRSSHPDEAAQVARLRAYKIEAGGRTYRIYRGDLHRHTDISTDGAGDGTVMDLHRYAIDAAALDFVLIGDHNMGNDNEYNWWRTQKANDLYSVPGAFLSLYGYERSVPYPNGHRNVIWTERGHRTLPLPNPAIAAQMQADTAKMYAYLRQTGGICTSHTSATGQGTNWKEHDDALEPIVELFQGFHASFEAPGAPRIVDADSDVVHTSFKPDGYVSHALEKGYRLGFQASSDHVSTHVSYACVLAEEFSRKGLSEAMKKRHTYAATDNIVLDVRTVDGALMGDEIRTAKPKFEVVVLGTGPIDRVDVLRNGAVLYSEKPTKDAVEARFRWEDAEPVKGEKPSYYYFRVLQKNGQMAWASPIWVRGTE